MKNALFLSSSVLCSKDISFQHVKALANELSVCVCVVRDDRRFGFFNVFPYTQTHTYTKKSNVKM